MPVRALELYLKIKKIDFLFGPYICGIYNYRIAQRYYMPQQYYLNTFICIVIDEKQECSVTPWERQISRTRSDGSSWESHRYCGRELYSLITTSLNKGIFH